MASGPSSQGSRTPAGAPPAADDAHLSPQPSPNSESVAMPATELVAHDKRHRRTSDSDFADAAPVFAAHEQPAEKHALQQPGAAKANKARTMKKRPYKSLRMSALLVFPTSDDESVGNSTSNEGGGVPVGAPAPPVSSKNDVPRHESLRMNASTGRFGGCSARQAKQPRRRS